PVACPHCDASVPIFPNRGRARDRFTFTSVAPKFVSSYPSRKPVAKVDPSYSSLGQQLCVDMVAGHRDFGLPINQVARRDVNTTPDFLTAKDGQSSQAGLALAAIPVGILLLFTPFAVCALFLLLAIPMTLFQVSNEQTELSSKLALAKQLGGVLEQGQVYTYVPEYRLLLGFSWVDAQIEMDTCQRIPEQHVFVVDIETTYTGNDDPRPVYHNTTFVSAADGSSVFPLMFHGGINSNEGAEARLADEPWRPFLNGPVVVQRS
ncbi:MAG: hypothetical protein ACPGQO_06265, partial [Candidatus Poseidoniaceae archaeon]